MDRKNVNRAQIGSIKEAVNIYGERLVREKPEKEKAHMETSKIPPSRAKELHLAKRDIVRLDDTRRFAEDVKARAEMDLFNARKTVKNLSQRIEESNMTTTARKKNLQGLKRSERSSGERSLAIDKINSNNQYMEVMRELDAVKQEISKMKLDMASVLEAKVQAERQREESTSRVVSYSSSLEALKKEIEEVNEEEVLVELARMEAVKEFKAIESQREAEAAQFSTTIEKTRTKIENLIQEINQSKGLEKKLEITISDINALQSELKLVRATDQSQTSNMGMPNQLISDGIVLRERKEDKQYRALLKSVTDELNEAKKELTRIKEEGFQFMTSMDIIRNELKHVSDEMARLKNLEEGTDSNVKSLNSKLIKAKSKLESASQAEEKTRSILSNLTATLQQLQTEMEAAKKERELIRKETENIKLEIQKTELDIEEEEEKLQTAIQELEAVKASEALALEKLKTLTEKTMKARAEKSLHSSSITISDFEYQYLTQRAEGAEEIANKKVAAAQAWIKALKAGEKEIIMKTDMVYRENRELKVMEEQELTNTEKAATATKAVQGELRNRREREKQTNESNLQLEVARPRKSMIEKNGPMTPKRNKMRKPASPGARYIGHSSSITLRKKRKVMPSLVKFFKSKKDN